MILELNQRVESGADAPEAMDVEIEVQLALLQKEAEDLQRQYDLRLKQHADVTEITIFNRDEKLQQAKAETLASMQQLANLKAMLAQAEKQILIQQSERDRLADEARELAPLKIKVQQLETLLAQLANQKNQIKGKEGLLYRDQVNSANYVCLVQLNGKDVKIKDAKTKTVESVANANGFISWFRAAGGQGRHFLVLIEPSGAPEFEAIRSVLQEESAVFGFDLVDSGHQASLTFEWEARP